MGSQQFCLRWNNHQVNMLDFFDNLYFSETFADVTIACEGVSIKAHKVVLSACSSFFQDIFINNPCKHPVVILKDMKLDELKAVLEFMYRGEVTVTQDQLSQLVKSAEALQVKGLAEMNSSLNLANKKPEPVKEGTGSPFKDSESLTPRKIQKECERVTANGIADNQEISVDESVSENGPIKMELDVAKNVPNCNNQSNSHPQLSALLDSGQVKRDSSSPSPSDVVDEDNFITDTSSGNNEENVQAQFVNISANDDGILQGSCSQVPEIKLSEFNENHMNNPDLSISPLDYSISQQNFEMLDPNRSWYQQWRSKRKRYKRYTQETLENAISTVLQGSLSQKRAAIIHGIPHETLRRHVKERKDVMNGLENTDNYPQLNGIDDNFSISKDVNTSPDVIMNNSSVVVTRVIDEETA